MPWRSIFPNPDPSEALAYIEGQYGIARPSKAQQHASSEALRASSDFWRAVGLRIPRILYVQRIGKNHVARFVSGTSGEPFILLSRKLKDYDEIEISIFHELVHAFYESSVSEEERLAPQQEEVVAESFAQLLWSRSIDPPALRGLLEAALR